MEQFRDEVYGHLKAFPFPPERPKVPVTVTGHPRPGLTVAYRPGKDAASSEEIVKEASKVGAAAGVGAGVGMGAGVVIGKFVFGTVVTRVGLASAGAAIGVGLAPLAAIGGVVGTVVYGAYRLGTLRRDNKIGKEFAKELATHLEQLCPSAEWPSVEVYVSLPDTIGVSQRSGSPQKMTSVMVYTNAEGQNDVFVRPLYAIGMARR